MNWQGSYSTYDVLKKMHPVPVKCFLSLYKSFARLKTKCAFEAAMIEICRSHLVAAFTPSFRDGLFVLAFVTMWTFA